MINLKKSQKSQKSWKVFISLNDLDKYLDAAKSALKSPHFKNLDREIKNFGLNMMDILDGFQKWVSTDQEILISISIDLNFN